MHVNIHDLIPKRTKAGWPKVQFRVTFCDKEPDGTLVPKFTSEGWAIYRSKARDATDDRGVTRTKMTLPSAPWMVNGIPRKWITTCSCEESLFEAIQEYVSSQRRVQEWLGLDKGSGKPEQDPDAPDLSDVTGDTHG